MELLNIKSKNNWRKWLSKNQNKLKGIWLVFYKNKSGKTSIDYETAVEEAICFGWIDSLVKKIDDEKYVRKFTPRKEYSFWSDTNKMRAKKVIKEGRMTKYGIEKIEAARKNGYWDKPIKTVKLSYDVPKDFITALRKNKKAFNNFNLFPPSCKKRYYMWINVAKKKETRERRIKESLQLLTINKELSLK